MFRLAWDGKGLTLDLTKVPNDILRLIVHWRNERVTEEAKQFPQVR